MADEQNQKVNKKSGSSGKDVAAMVVVLLIIAVYIFIECYNAVHVDVETITAVTSTVYDTIEVQALVIRDEHIIETDSGAVTVACVDNGEKVKVGGNIAMQFSDEQSAADYSTLQSLHTELDYYVELESKSAGVATDVETIDRDILSDINTYILSANYFSADALSDCADDLNDKLTRRQMIIGQNIDFSSVKSELQSQINAVDADSCSPTGYVTTDESGIFSSYTDALETAFDYDSVESLDVDTLNSYIEQAQNAEKSESFGKLITSYEWYFCAVVSADDVSNIQNGDELEVAIKDSDDSITCEVLSGADVSLGETETVLVLKCSQMDSEIASMRLEDIEIRYASYTGFKVPTSAIHIDEDGNKCVYALVANEVSLRQGEIIYSTDDYAIFEYDPDNSDAIRLYDRIITEGKDLYDGKIYT